MPLAPRRAQLLLFLSVCYDCYVLPLVGEPLGFPQQYTTVEADGCPEVHNDDIISLLQVDLRVDESKSHSSELPQPLADLISVTHAPSLACAVAATAFLVCAVVGAIILSQCHLQNTKLLENDKWSYSIRGIAVFVTVLVAACAAYCVLFYFAGAILIRIIEQYDIAFLGVHVRAEEITLNPFNGLLSLGGLQILNPPGYKSEYLLTASTLTIDLDMVPLVFSLGKSVHVELFHMENVRVIYERGLTTSNIRDVVNNLSGGSSTSRVDSSSDTPQGTNVHLHKVVANDVWVKVALHITGNSGVSLAVPDIIYQDFEQEVGESTTDEIVSVILGTILKSAAHAVSGT